MPVTVLNDMRINDKLGKMEEQAVMVYHKAMLHELRTRLERRILWNINILNAFFVLCYVMSSCYSLTYSKFYTNSCVSTCGSKFTKGSKTCYQQIDLLK